MKAPGSERTHAGASTPGGNGDYRRWGIADCVSKASNTQEPQVTSRTTDASSQPERTCLGLGVNSWVLCVIIKD